MAHSVKRLSGMGSKSKKHQRMKIVFVCVENARRSQMAEGFANLFGQGKIEVYSAGSSPSFQIDPLVIEVMKEKGIDLSGKPPKSLNDLPPVEMDYLITMGCEETCPVIPTKKIIEWEIPDPKGKPIETFREVRDMIESKVKGFLRQIGGLH
jgi:arsenate reductase (thioredoxin)